MDIKLSEYELAVSKQAVLKGQVHTILYEVPGPEKHTYICIMLFRLDFHMHARDDGE